MKGYYKIRFDILDNAEYSSYLDEICDLCASAVFYYHPDGKTDGKSPHIHGLLLDYKHTDETLRNNTKKRFSLVGKETCTISNTFKRGTKMSEFTYQGYITYMSKGQYDPVCIKGFTRQECDLAKDLWKLMEPEPKNIVIEPKEKLKPKLTQFQLSYEVRTRWMMSHGDDEKPDYDEMLDIVLEVCRENRTLVPDRIAINIIQDIQSYYDTTKFKNRVLRQCML